MKRKIKEVLVSMAEDYRSRSKDLWGHYSEDADDYAYMYGESSAYDDVAEDIDNLIEKIDIGEIES